jgi:flavin reductase (DIM6/NTAB) family NADH-FMN oxidoreductase RutF
MTASWGALGILWNKPVATCYIRPARYTFGFMNDSEFFTLSFFDEKYKKILNYLGSTSGRDINKIEQSKLTPVFTKNESIYFGEARLVFECRKIYSQDLIPENFVQPSLMKKIYPTGDFHRMFIGEIVNCLSNK